MQPPVPIAVIATLRRRQGVELALQECSLDEGVLAVLRHAGGASVRPEFALVMTRTAVRGATLLAGDWDRAEDTLLRR